MAPKRFGRLSGRLRRAGARNPAALAAWIGRKKYGSRRMAQLAAAGRRRAQLSRTGRRTTK